jgi:trimeric autotransporter adhesin
MKKIRLFSFAILGGVSISSAQNINTVGGNGVAGYSGSGGLATDAELDAPNGMGIDTAGNVYSANSTSECISKISTSGILTIVAGIGGVSGFSGDGGQATAAELNGPNEVTFDIHGNMYIVERYNNDVRMVNTSGIISTVAGNGSGTWSGDGAAATAAGINDPGGVAVDNKGNIYIAEYGSSVIRKVNTSGIISTIAGQSGNPGYNGDGIAATAAQINYAIGVAADTIGNVYIGDNYNNRVRIINTSGIINTLAGNGTAAYSGDGGPATAAEVNWPDHLFIDQYQNLYITDVLNGRIRMVTTSGIISTVAGNGVEGYSGDSGPATSAELDNPSGVVVSLSGNVFIDDEINNRVREIKNYLGVGINEINNTTGLYIFPNPADQTLSVSIGRNFTSGILTITDITGKCIVHQQINTPQTNLQLDVSNFASGMYFIQIQNEGEQYIGKFIKE